MGAKAAVIVTPTDVREWATKNGHTVSNRGRLHSTIIEAYNKSNKVKYDSNIKPDAGSMVALKGKRKTESGRTVPWQKTVSTTEIRRAALEAGIPLGSRGRIHADIMQAYADNTLADLAANWSERQAAKSQARSNEFKIIVAESLEADADSDEAPEEAESDGPAAILEAPEGDGETSVTV